MANLFIRVPTSVYGGGGNGNCGGGFWNSLLILQMPQWQPNRQNQFKPRPPPARFRFYDVVDCRIHHGVQTRQQRFRVTCKEPTIVDEDSDAHLICCAFSHVPNLYDTAKR